MNFPIDLSFKLMALASQIRVTDANGQMLGYVKQKLFKLKNEITVFADEAQTNPLFGIKADRIIDFSAKYNFTAANGAPMGSIRRRGMRSIWKASYDIFNTSGQQVLKIHEENDWIKVIDALVGELPVVGMFTGYLFNPAYLIERMDGTVLMRLAKQPAFFEGKFQLTPQMQIPPNEETRLLLGVLAMTMLERMKG